VSGSKENSASGSGKNGQQGNQELSTGSGENKNNGNARSSGSQSGPVTGTPLGIQGSEIRSNEKGKEISIDGQKAKDAGETITVEGKNINVAKGPVTISIATTADPRQENGIITGDIKSISMKNEPATAAVKDAGTVSASFDADLVSLPPNDATITATILEQPDPAVVAAYHGAVAKQGYQIGEVAYAMNVGKTHLEDGKDIGSATVRMSVAPSWVANRGGPGDVKIARYADDGTSQVLETRFIGFDSSSNMVFEGTSPGGLSIFALITVKTPQVTITPQPTTPASIPSPQIITSLAGISLLLFFILLVIRKL
jgi:hypothetical protein